MFALRKAAATAADTSSSSLGRMRGPVWKSWIREPNALKIEATCTPVAPAPTTSIDGGTEVKPQASLWVFVNSKPGTESRRLTPPVQMTIFSARSRSPLLVSMVCSSTKRATPACSWTATPKESICGRKEEWARTWLMTSRTRASSRG